MQSDRELLELAAKAAGFREFQYCEASGGLQAIYVDDDDIGFWDPLTDDGDALRLAVKLGIEVGNYHQYGRALASIGCTRGVGEFWEINPDDHCAATRRAIVRAAAEIGRGIS